jgi:hypothetical protein
MRKAAAGLPHSKSLLRKIMRDSVRRMNNPFRAEMTASGDNYDTGAPQRDDGTPSQDLPREKFEVMTSLRFREAGQILNSATAFAIELCGANI